MNEIIQLITVCAIPLIFAITMHESAHGWAAMKFGDRTAYMQGRVSLNPARHIDPFGTVVVPLLMIAASAAVGGGGIIFGWAKPVPVSVRALRNPKRDMMWVALAGPACNLLQAVGWAVVLKVLVTLGVEEMFFLRMAAWGISINIFLMAFNLIPIPPLDGGRVAVGLLPWKYAQMLARLEPYGFFIVIALAVIGGTSFLIAPLVAFGRAVINLVIGM